ncbi:molybdopterin oxidoreductase [Cellulomonas marina]|uniref:Molybdopterin oxidoreductase n=1 Tax=Cellulomonas marina TaxID=988821 RepID=A0A1I1ATP8_9CELL|nr:molybdopterin oxidoreductase [Cellulomonas marina]GIG30271.1 hypothetical protein Cma02nite_28710 [Cellulomonas marina]SFB40902.1 hypothetical protein SAMN05421867_1224 [Cellulomonas marina]
MSARTPQRSLRRTHPEWWVVSAWGSLVLVLGAGLAAAAGLGPA